MFKSAAVVAHDDALESQRARARALAHARRCPHCDRPLTRFDVLALVRGEGVAYPVRIRLTNGRVAVVDEGQFNPQTMLWADD